MANDFSTKDPNDAFLISGAAWNKITQEVKRIGNMAGTGGIAVTSGPQGITIRNTRLIWEPAIIKISATPGAPAGGKYYGYTYSGFSNADDTATHFTMPNNLKVDAHVNALVVNLAEEGFSNKSNILPSNRTVLGYVVGSYTASSIFYKIVMVESYRRPIIPVALSQTGGTAGDLTHQASFTYTVTDLDTGVNLGTTIAPLYNRRVGKMVAATHGMAYINDSGTCILMSCDEVPSTANC